MYWARNNRNVYLYYYAYKLIDFKRINLWITKGEIHYTNELQVTRTKQDTSV